MVCNTSSTRGCDQYFAHLPPPAILLDPCKHRNGSLTFYRSLWQLLVSIRKSLNIFLTSPIRGRYFNLRLATPLPPLLAFKMIDQRTSARCEKNERRPRAVAYLWAESTITRFSASINPQGSKPLPGMHGGHIPARTCRISAGGKLSGRRPCWPRHRGRKQHLAVLPTQAFCHDPEHLSLLI